MITLHPISVALCRAFTFGATFVALVCSAQIAPQKFSFDVPAGEAKPMLRQFAAQARREIVFSSDSVSAVRTNAVKGEMTPQEAIDRMLANTGLLAAQDAKTGAFAVRHETETEAKNGARAAPAGDRPKVSTDTEPETLILSPFEVRTDRDTGFVAASSLAGGRLATDLMDTPVAYSVITRDFIDALGLTDLVEAAQWSPNTVVSVSAGGVGGAGGDVSNDSYGYMVRGGVNGRQQRNFFLYHSPMDSYAIERYDFGRGPNAVLFGNGSLGGVSSSTTKQARFDRPFRVISAGYGSWNKLRATVDINQPVTDKAAVRAAAMWSDGDGWRDRQFEKSKAIFLTGTYKLTKNTSIRLEGEYGTQARNQTFANIVDALAGWDGRSTYSGTLTARPANGDAIGVDLRGVNYWLYDRFSGQNAIMNYQGDPITMSANANQNVPIAGFVQGPPPTATTPGNRPYGAAGSSLLYAQWLPANMYDNAIAGSAFRVPSPSFTTAQDVPTIRQRFKDFQLTVDHRIGGVFIQLAIDHNRTRQFVNAPDVRNANITYVDINRLLPNGATNPHFLQPYSDAFLRTNEDERNADGVRIAVGTAKDFGKWGSYTANVMGGYTLSEVNKIGAWNLSITQNPDRRRWGASGTQLPSTDRIRLRNYWNETERPYTVPSSIRLIDPVTGLDKTITPVMALENDRSDSLQGIRSIYTHAIAAMTAKYWKKRIVVLGAVRVDNFYNYTRQQLHGGDYPATTWDGRTGYFKPKAPSDYATLAYVVKDANGVGSDAPVPADTRPRDANGNRLSQYANDRFRDDYNGPATDKRVVTPSVGGVFHVRPWLSPYINYAETFNPPSVIQRLDSSFLPPTVAKGVDYGMRLTLLRGRVNMNFLKYENSEENNAVDPFTQGNINNILSAAPLPSLNNGSTVGRNLHQVPNVPGVVRDLQDRTAKGTEVEITANLTTAWRLTFNLGFPEIYVKSGLPDTRKYLEGNDAIMRKIVADAGVIITTTPTDPIGTATVDASIPVTQRSPDANAVVNAWNGLRGTRQGFVAATVPRLTQDQPTMNIYSDYSFRTGKLRGLRVGAGWQYRGEIIVGNLGGRLMVDPADPTRAIDDPTVGGNDPYRAPGWSNVVATVNYIYRLEKGRELGFQLRVDNVLNERDPLWTIGTATRPTSGAFTSPARDVVPASYGLRSPINYTLSTTLKF